MRLPAYISGFLGWIDFGVWTLALGVAMLCLWPFDPDRRRMALAMRFIWGRVAHRANPMWTIRAEGSAGPGPYVIVSNHQSHTDIPQILGVLPPVRIVARDGIFRAPVMGWFLRLSRQVHQDRFEAEATAALREGFSVLVFPEGSRSPDGRIQRFRNGAFEVARSTGVPVLPVVLDGSRWMLGKGDLFPRRARFTVRVAVLPPIDPAAFSSTTELKQATHRAMKAVLEAW